MPGLYDSLTAAMLLAGPRRVTADGVVHAEPPAHVPPVPDDYRTRSREHAAERDLRVAEAQRRFNAVRWWKD